MAALCIYLDGDESDIEFIRERAVGAVQDVIAEYAQNLESEIEVSWNWAEE